MTCGSGDSTLLGRSPAGCAGERGGADGPTNCRRMACHVGLGLAPCGGLCRCFIAVAECRGRVGRRTWRGSRVLRRGYVVDRRLVAAQLPLVASTCATLGWDGRTISTQGGTHMVFDGVGRLLSVARALAKWRPRSDWGGLVFSTVCARAAEHPKSRSVSRSSALASQLAMQLAGRGQGGPVDDRCGVTVVGRVRVSWRDGCFGR